MLGSYAEAMMVGNQHTADDAPVSGGLGDVLKRGQARVQALSDRIAATDDGDLLEIAKEEQISIDALRKHRDMIHRQIANLMMGDE